MPVLCSTRSSASSSSRSSLSFYQELRLDPAARSCRRLQHFELPLCSAAGSSTLSSRLHLPLPVRYSTARSVLQQGGEGLLLRTPAWSPPYCLHAARPRARAARPPACPPHARPPALRTPLAFSLLHARASSSSSIASRGATPLSCRCSAASLTSNLLLSRRHLDLQLAISSSCWHLDL
jgi:hypothetical protein